MQATSLIIGCGYLGQRVAERLLAQGHTVYGTTRSRPKALAAIGVRPMIVHVTQPLTFPALQPALQSDPLDVYYLVPPGRSDSSPTPRQTILGGIAHVVKQLKHARVRRAVLVSSTAVYGQSQGELVNAQTPAQPQNERAELLLEGERLWLDANPTHHVVRLAGIYGPKRVVGLRAVADGSPIVGNPDALLNLIHVDDAANLLLAVMHSEPPHEPARVELGCDGHPIPRRDYYAHLAHLMHLPSPATLTPEQAANQLGLDAARLSRTASKSLDPIPTCQRTGWTPVHTDVREQLPHLIKRQPT